jgi:hypothetical protein
VIRRDLAPVFHTAGVLYQAQASTRPPADLTWRVIGATGLGPGDYAGYIRYDERGRRRGWRRYRYACYAVAGGPRALPGGRYLDHARTLRAGVEMIARRSADQGWGYHPATAR